MTPGVSQEAFENPREVFYVKVVEVGILANDHGHVPYGAGTGVREKTHAPILVAAENAEQAEVVNAIHFRHGFGADVLRKSVVVRWNVRVEIFFRHARLPMRTVVNGAG